MAEIEKDIGIGLVGSGMGSLFLRINEDRASRMELRGIYDTDPARRHQRYDVGKSLAELAEEFHVDFLADEYADLLDRGDIHVIAVFSPCPCHFDQIMAALEAGKHVIVTKPMVTSIQQARSIVSLVERTGRKMLVAQSMRWNAMFQEIHRLYESGEIGEVTMAEAYYVHDMRTVLDVSPWRYEMPQDFVYGGLCHPFDLLRWHLGEVDEVFAYASRGKVETRYPADKEDNFIVSARFRNGVMARILGGFDLVHPPNLWAEPFHGVGIGLYGTKASLFNDRIVYDCYGRGGPEEQRVQPPRDNTDHAGEVLAFIRHFEHCIVNDAKPLVDVIDGAQVIAFCDAVWQSVHSGQAVKVTREFDR